MYHKSILLGGLLATKSITEQESTHAIREARKKEGKKKTKQPLLDLKKKRKKELQPSFVVV